MSRSTEPRLKIIRRLRTELPGLTGKSAEKKPYPPGQHGPSQSKKMSAYRIRLEEKQKLRFNYGLSERQLRRFFKQASAMKGNTGENLLKLLESRLDNVVFRAGFAPTIPSARQLVNHGHVLVNDKRVDIASYQVRSGDVIAIKEASRNMPVIAQTIKTPSLTLPAFLTADAFTAKCVSLPSREDVPLIIEDHLVIEYYARMS